MSGPEISWYGEFFWKHHSVRTEKLHWKKVKKIFIFFFRKNIFFRAKNATVSTLRSGTDYWQTCSSSRLLPNSCASFMLISEVGPRGPAWGEICFQKYFYRSSKFLRATNAWTRGWSPRERRQAFSLLCQYGTGVHCANYVPYWCLVSSCHSSSWWLGFVYILGTLLGTLQQKLTKNFTK